MINKLINIFKKVNEDQNPWKDERSENVYAVAALFNTPNEIIHAAEKVSGDGYKDFDVNTPYPVHGMDDAMKLKPTRLGWFSFALGLTGTLTALSMIFYMNGIDYNNIIGGKPFFNFPPSIPVTFALTILFTGLTTAGVLIALFSKLPWLNNPLLDSDYSKATSQDKYGIYIKSSDPKFNQSEIENLFKLLGSSAVSLIYDSKVNEKKIKTPIFEAGFIKILIGVAIATSAITYITLNWLIFQPPFDWMVLQPKVLPQEKSKIFADGFGMREPVAGTVARGYMPYEYKGMPDSVVKLLSNPLPVNEKTLLTGQKRYDTYCSPCHGNYGKGDSRLRGQFPNPPSLLTDKLINWTDGNIYHVITNGQNVMSSYAKQISRDDRWAIVHYIRALQRSQNAKDSDLN